MSDFEDDIQDDEVFQRRPVRLLNGIDLRDLTNQNECVFEINSEYNDQPTDEDLISIYEKSVAESLPDLEKLRKTRGAPRPEASFQTIASEMKAVDDLGLVKKQLIQAGTGTIVPDHAQVIVHYNFYKEFDENPFDSTFLRGRPHKLRLSIGEAIPGLEMAIKTMKKGENSRFLINHMIAYGERGIPPRIPPRCDVYADITLKDFTECLVSIDPNALTEEELTKKSFDESMKEIDKIRHDGNKYFQSKNYPKASRWYKKAIDLMNRLHLANEEEEKQMMVCKIKSLTNLAISYNKENKPEWACKASQEVLSHDPYNDKAKVQLAIGKYLLGDYVYAEKLLKEAQRKHRGDPTINEYLKKVDQKKRKTEIIEKEMWTKAFMGDDKNSVKEKKSSNIGCDLEEFEADLKTDVNEHFESSVEDYVHTGHLTRQEKEICTKVASDLNLEFQVEGRNRNIFKLKMST